MEKMEKGDRVLFKSGANGPRERVKSRKHWWQFWTPKYRWVDVPNGVWVVTHAANPWKFSDEEGDQ